MDDIAPFIWSSYLAAALVLAALVSATLLRARRIKKRLQLLEHRQP